MVKHGAAVLRGDALALPFAAESVDLIITSPPYYAQRSYKDGGTHYAGQIGAEPGRDAYLASLWDVMGECWRVLKSSGSAFVNMGDKRSNKARLALPERFVIGCADQGWVYRQRMVWEKLNGLPDTATDRTRDNFEDWYHLTKSTSYFSCLDDLRDGYEGVPQRRFTQRIKDRRDEGRPISPWTVRWDEPKAGEGRGKLPGSVWRIATESYRVPEHVGTAHLAPFPQEWPRQLILGWSPPGGVVLDPFGGSGTTAMVARALGRYGISVDLSADYLRLARWRIFESGHGAKSIERTNVERQGVLV